MARRQVEIPALPDSPGKRALTVQMWHAVSWELGPFTTKRKTDRSEIIQDTGAKAGGLGQDVSVQRVLPAILHRTQADTNPKRKR